jgi:triosephosphate isomerase
VRHALAHGLIPILCIGEKERDTDALYLQQLRLQISSVLQPLTPKERLGVVIAYEPLWAIGPNASGAITPEDLQEMILYLRKVLAEFMVGRANEKIKMLYGGSVNADDAFLLTSGTGIDGLLIGRASTNVAMFTALVKALR